MMKGNNYKNKNVFMQNKTKKYILTVVGIYEINNNYTRKNCYQERL